MKKFLVLSFCLVCATAANTAFAAVDAAFLKENNRISDQQKALYIKVDELSNIKFDRELNAAETVQYNTAVCATLAAEHQLTQLWLSNIEQTRLLLDDESLTAEAIAKIMQDSVSYDAAQELKGTPAECK